jgi:hypothetical protein
MKVSFTKAPTFTKAIIASAVFTIVYLATTSSLPSCSDTIAVLNSGGECLERPSLLHTASGWLALICLLAAALLLILKHKDRILGWQASLQQPRRDPAAPAAPRMPVPAQAPMPAPAPMPTQAPMPAQAPMPTPMTDRSSNFCAACGTRIIAGDRFCQGCGVPMGSPQS